MFILAPAPSPNTPMCATWFKSWLTNSNSMSDSQQYSLNLYQINNEEDSLVFYLKISNNVSNSQNFLYFLRSVKSTSIIENRTCHSTTEESLEIMSTTVQYICTVQLNSTTVQHCSLSNLVYIYFKVLAAGFNDQCAVQNEKVKKKKTLISFLT